MSRTASLLALISSAVLTAFALTAFLVYQFGTTGSYLAQNVLIAPDLIPTLSFNAPNPKSGGQSRFVFDQLKFIYFDKQAQKAIERVVSLDKYQEFYSEIKKDKSLPDGEKITSLFIQANPARLEVGMHSNDVNEPFQQVEFASEGNYYRILLRQESGIDGNWAYYYHPNIESLALKIFTE